MTENARRLAALALVVVIVESVHITQSLAADLVIDSFDDASSLSCWWLRWGPVQGDWDPTRDAGGGYSGALSLSLTYTNDPGADNNFGFGRPFCCTCSTWDLATIDATRYREVAASIRWDTNSTVDLDTYNTDGEHGLVAGFWTLTNGMMMLPAVPIPHSASNGWVRMHWPIDFTIPGIDRSEGFILKKWDTQNLAGNVRFWVDDITLVSYPCCEPPPMLFIEQAQPGLNLFTGGSYVYDRENIRTARDLGNFSWIGSGDAPVSYSFTVTNVDFAGTNFQIHLFLIPNPADESAPDWSEPAVVRADLWNVGEDNHGQWTLSYKTNNSSYESIPAQYTSLTSVIDASMLGTWTLTFRNDTNITMTAPSGASTNITIPYDVAGYFADQLLVYFGVQANATTNEGRAASLTAIAIEGTPIPIHENFSEPLDTNLWEVIAGYPPGVLVVDPGAWWVKWPIPDAGFYLQTNSILSDAAGWSTNGLPVPITIAGHRQVLIPGSMGPGSTQSLFFRLKR